LSARQSARLPACQRAALCLLACLLAARPVYSPPVRLLAGLPLSVWQMPSDPDAWLCPRPPARLPKMDVLMSPTVKHPPKRDFGPKRRFGPLEASIADRKHNSGSPFQKSKIGHSLPATSYTITAFPLRLMLKVLFKKKVRVVIRVPTPPFSSISCWPGCFYRCARCHLIRTACVGLLRAHPPAASESLNYSQ